MNRTLHMLHQLDCPVGQFGTTVRRGMKWSDSLNQDIVLCVCDGDGRHKIEGNAKVTETWVGTFSQVPARLIEQEHEERSRRYSGLLDSMRKAYGKEFREDELIVVLTYYRLQ